MKASKVISIALVFVTALAIVALMNIRGSAQQSDEQRRFLEVRRRQLELEAARKQLERTQKLAHDGLVSDSDLDRDRNAVRTAQLNYQQAVLALLDLQPRISVRAAMKTQTPDGRKFVHLSIVNLTPTFDDSQFKLLNNFEGAEPIPEQLRTRSVNDVFVSLRDTGGGIQVNLNDGNSSNNATANSSNRGNATISLPYEVHIPRLAYGEQKTLDFQLLRDVDTVTVALSYRNQTQEIPVQLQHASGGSEIQITSSQLSQEADLNSQVTYSLSLERPSVDVRSFQLKVVNLPHQINYSFIDPQSQARLSQINFPAGVTRQSLGLRLSLPERADDSIRLDTPMEFSALALDEAAAARFAQERIYSEPELQAVGPGRIRLVVTPRGVGRIEVAAASLFSEITTGGEVEAKITVRNTGSRRLDNVKLSAEYPLNWRVEIRPDLLPSLELNREEEVSVRLIPPHDVGVGDYETRIKTESFADNRRVQSEDKIYRVSVKAPVNIWGTAGLIGGLLLIVAGIAVFGVKLTRR